MIIWDWFTAESIFKEIVIQQLGMIAILLAVFFISFVSNFYKAAQNIGTAIMVILMANVTGLKIFSKKALKKVMAC